MATRNKKCRGATKKRAQRATSNVFAMFDQVTNSQKIVWINNYLLILIFYLFI